MRKTHPHNSRRDFTLSRLSSRDGHGLNIQQFLLCSLASVASVVLVLLPLVLEADSTVWKPVPFCANNVEVFLTLERVKDRGFAVREPLPLPTEPPYTVHVGNLSFDATSADISDLFADCSVTNVRIVEDKLTHSPKGFGYVEFETVDGLKKALDLSGATLQGRAIRISIAEPRKCFLEDGWNVVDRPI